MRNPRRERKQRTDLASFLVASFVPAKQALEHAKQIDEAPFLDHSRCWLLEIYWWLHLGVEIDFFPRREAWEFLVHLNEALRGSGEFLDFLRRKALLPDQLWRMLETSRQRGGIEDAFAFTTSEKLSQNPRLHGYFQTVQLMATRFAGDLPAQLFSALITFAKRKEWERATETELSSKYLKLVLIDPLFKTEPEMNLLISGYLRFLDQMARVRYFFREVLPQDDAIADSDRYGLERKVRAIYLWRLNLTLTDIKQRFDSTTTETARLLARELQTDKTSPISISDDQFQAKVTDLVDDWLSTSDRRPKTMHA